MIELLTKIGKSLITDVWQRSICIPVLDLYTKCGQIIEAYPEPRQISKMELF